MPDLLIDVGHGGYDSGAVGPSGLQEKDVNLNVARKLRQYLPRMGVSVELSRDSDVFVSPWDIRTMGRSGNYKYLLSIHHNGHPESVAHGAETFYRYDKGKDLATIIQREMLITINRRDRGVKQGNWIVLDVPNIPAALVEPAFITNPVEEQLLSQEWFLEKEALGLAYAVRLYVKSGSLWQRLSEFFGY